MKETIPLHVPFNFRAMMRNVPLILDRVIYVQHYVFLKAFIMHGNFVHGIFYA